MYTLDFLLKFINLVRVISKSRDNNKIKMKLFFKVILLIAFVFLSISYDLAGQIVINEFMSNNEMTISDQDGEYSDWIELYNTSDVPVNLLNYSLSDKSDKLDKWIFPNITIDSHNYLLVFASGENRLNIDELHTNFKISSSGESLFLSNAMEQLIDQVEPIELSADQSYGRIPDGADNFLTLNFCTPKNPNVDNNIITLKYESGFYTNPFYQKITSLTDDVIYYTLDGSIPTEESNVFPDSLIMDYNYSTPNFFSNIPTTPADTLLNVKAWEAPNEVIDKANILRYASYHNGTRTSEIYTHTYIVDSTIVGKYEMPVISLITDAKNLFGHEEGIYVPGVYYDANNPQWTGNYYQRDEAWERPVHISYYEKDGTLQFSQNAGIKIHGGKTRQGAQKSFKLYARNEYGKKYFDYPLMPHREHVQYKRFILRTTMGTWQNTLLNDVFAHEVARGLGINYQDYQPAVVFVNGEYWGIHTIRDRIDERYIGYSYDVNQDSVEFRGFINFPWAALMQYISSNDLSEDEHYDFVKEQIDIENFIDYHITEMFFQNTDWPANNMELWKEKNATGKWRWIFYDIDGGFHNHKYNMFEHMAANDSTISHPNSPSSTFLYRHLMKNQNFKNQFINRYAALLNNDFQTDTLNRKLNQLMDLYESEISRHFARWNYNEGVPDWKITIDSTIREFIQNRPCAVENNLVDFFNVSTFAFDCVRNGDENPNNSFVFAPNPNDGSFFLFNKTSEDIRGNILVYDMFGRIVYLKDDIFIGENEKEYFNLSHLPNNTYFFIFRNENFKEGMKFILVK